MLTRAAHVVTTKVYMSVYSIYYIYYVAWVEHVNIINIILAFVHYVNYLKHPNRYTSQCRGYEADEKSIQNTSDAPVMDLTWANRFQPNCYHDKQAHNTIYTLPYKQSRSHETQR